ncbi:MAG: tyrosine--tRNA ligase [Candidatus Magasanikbacteria bacterium CG10_big_fil_rev_8_21_14_0_10_40_10]|uniref:Tyrosine--tRNA ligase n=1 Tax=Candidatus Magasanikbacteria bacterium CG10_big_fil_rev_8_21_14_0_10_40_10 TaxID=1974648 RepID=A0A2M6W556_9BACT|nr:MAG: tyrosine--tRNA ligase [Candidatus Magasanikbacteria bacterium CG10_big_fil_rev_8_21_14_0_10_40_10]
MVINTDPQKIDELLTRGVENIYPKKEWLQKELESGRRLSLYTGYDPTAPTLHIGHGITLMKLRQFQDLGHRVIMLIGDFTGMIGDPTDKTAVRSALTKEQVMENCREYQKQAGHILDFTGNNAVELKYNSEWLGKMNFADVLQLTSHFTVQRMLERDMFDKRMKDAKPIYLHEFMYPVMQGYDCVAMDVDGEVGGNDQTFNMLAGRTLMKDLKNKEKFVLAMKLLTDNAGKKMGKSEGNMIAFTDSPQDMFGKVMSWSDEMILNGFELCTRVNMDEIKQMEKEMKAGANPRDYKLKLAHEITMTFLGESAAKIGREHFATVIQSKDRPDEINELKPSAYDIVTVLVESKMASSKTDARKLVVQNAVKINDQKADNIDAIVKPGDVIQKGKRFFVKVI